MFSYDWGKPTYFSCEWCFAKYVVHNYTQPVSMQLLSVSGVRNICYGIWNGSFVILILLHLTDRRTKDHRYLQSHQLLLTRTEPWPVRDL